MEGTRESGLAPVERRRLLLLIACVLVALMLVLPTATVRAPVWLPSAPTWSTGGADFLDVALGDVDKDLDLDLAAYASDRIRLFENVGGVLQTNAKWTSGVATTSFRGRVVWADLNNDGFPELVTSDGIFANTNGTLAATPTFTKLVGSAAFAVGDVNLDGFLDVVVAGASAIELYRNSGGTIDSTPIWNTTENNRAGALVLGDTDRDGFPELIVGNRGGSRPIRLYHNVGGNLDRVSSWSSAETDLVNQLALGDVNRDGYPELVSATDNLFGQVPNRMHKNNNGTFERIPSWNSSRPTSGTDVAFADINMDGYPDLVIANVPMIRIPDLTYFDGREQVYLNERGVIDNVSDWQSAYEDVTYGLALGDVDGDGYIDLVTANSADLLGSYPGRVLLYRNQGPPNNPPEIVRVDSVPASPKANETVVIIVTATDADNDPLVYSFSFTNGTRVSQSGNQLTWRAPNEGGNFTIHIEVNDGRGGLASADKVVPVTPPPPPPQKPPSESPFFSFANPSFWVLIVLLAVAIAGSAAVAVRKRKRTNEGSTPKELGPPPG